MRTTPRHLTSKAVRLFRFSRPLPTPGLEQPSPPGMRLYGLSSGSRNAGFVAAVSDLALIIIGSFWVLPDHWNGGGCDVVAGIPLRFIRRRLEYFSTICFRRDNRSVRKLGDYGTERGNELQELFTDTEGCLIISGQHRAFVEKTFCLVPSQFSFCLTLTLDPLDCDSRNRMTV